MWDSLPVDVKDQIMFGYFKKTYFNSWCKYCFAQIMTEFVCLTLLNKINLHKLVCWQNFKEIHSIVIQFAFGNPTGVCQVVLLCITVSCVTIVSFEHVCILMSVSFCNCFFRTL